MFTLLLALTLSAGPSLQTGSDGTIELTERERLFKEHFGNSRLVGSFTLDSHPDDAPEKDSYEIQSIEKLPDGRWKITALVSYGERSVPFSLPVPVEWAGDTPVLCITNLPIPFMGTYSARVLIDGERYAGTWSGKDHGGHMFGYLRPKQEQEKAGGEEEENGSPKTGMAEQNWPQYRGEKGRGVAEGFRTVARWDIEGGDNIRWRTELAGMAHSSPVIWGERIYLTNAVRKQGRASLKVGLYGSIEPVPDEGEHDFLVQCVDKRTGNLLWSRTAWSGVPKYPRHPKGSFAASTPATDGENVVAFYGVEGLFCYDTEGDLKWKKDMGDLYSAFFVAPDHSSWGFASSPVIHEGKLIVQCDVMGQSFLSVMELDTGKEIWRAERDEVPTWSTPTVHVSGARSQVICNGYRHIGGYDLASGAELWKLVGGGDIPVPTPIVSDDTIFITSSHGRMRPIYAISTAAEGEFSMDPQESEHMLWSYRNKGIYMQTPLAYGEFVYFCSGEGVVRCLAVEGGEEVYRERLGAGRSGFTSSAVAADGKLYFSSEEGRVFVVREGWEFELIAENDLGEEMMSTPAVSEGVLYFRTRAHLVAVGRTDA